MGAKFLFIYILYYILLIFFLLAAILECFYLRDTKTRTYTSDLILVEDATYLLLQPYINRKLTIAYGSSSTFKVLIVAQYHFMDLFSVA